MDTSDSVIKFNDDGICDHCTTFDSNIATYWDNTDNFAALEKLTQKIKKSSRNKDYDCIIGMSGGIDSSYLLHIAKRVMGLNPLVFHVDGGWNSQEAVNNIEKLVDKLDVDLYTEVINWSEMRDLQLAFFKASVPHIDTPQDHAFFATMYKFAEKYNIKYILKGANFSTEGIRNPIEWMYYQSDSVQLKDIHKKFGSVKLNSFPITSIIRHKIWLPYFKRIQVIRPLNYVNYNKQTAINFLTKEYGWMPYPQKHFESRFTRFYEGYWLPKKFGFDTRKVQFSSLILTKQMTREEALRLLSFPPLSDDIIKQELEFVSKKLQISLAELNAYLLAENKSYKDYKSQQNIYNLGAKAMKFLGIELGGKR